MIARIDEFAARRPEAVAVWQEKQFFTYRQLQEASKGVAQRLHASGVTAGCIVGVCLPAGFDLLVAILAIARCRAVYLPLDPEHPPAHRERILAETQPHVIIRDVWEINEKKASLRFEETAYIMYTSGTTGQPKGVMISWDNLDFYLRSAQQAFQFRDTDIFCNVARATFSISLFDLLLPLTVGASVRFLERGEIFDRARLVEALAQSTVFHAGPSLLATLFRYGPLPSLRHVSSGGDLVLPQVMKGMKRCFPNAELFVIYGTTEISCMGTWLPLTRPFDRPLVGRPFPGVGVELVEGEICFTGPGIGQGYFQKPELTADRFRAGVYRTGDYGRWDADGNLEMLGRRDFQVQLRGVRIELTGIENQILELGLATHVAVVHQQRGEDSGCLVAFLAGASSEDAGRARKLLSERIPAEWMPARFVFLPQLPTTFNGKVDRRAMIEWLQKDSPSREPLNNRERPQEDDPPQAVLNNAETSHDGQSRDASSNAQRPHDGQSRDASSNVQRPHDGQSRDASYNAQRPHDGQSRDASSNVQRPHDGQSRDASYNAQRPHDGQSRDASSNAERAHDGQSRDASYNAQRPHDGQFRDASSNAQRSHDGQSRDASYNAQRPHDGQSRDASSNAERAILEILRSSLDFPLFHAEQNFFEAGGHSLLAIHVLSALNEQHGIHIPPLVFFQKASARELAAYWMEARGGAPSISSCQTLPLNTPTPTNAIFLVAGAPIYRPLAQALNHQWSAYALVSEEECHPLRPTSAQSMEDLAQSYAQSIIERQGSGPYYILGYSFAGILAFEIARQLTAAGHEVRRLFLLDAALPENIFRWRHRFRQIARLLRTRPTDFFTYLRYKLSKGRGTIDPRTAGMDRERGHRNRIFAHDYMKRMPSYAGEAVLFVAGGRLKQKPLLSRTCGWRPYLPQLKVVTTPGDHHALIQDPQCLQHIIREIQAAGA